MKAVASFSGGIHLILGGKDKDSDYSLLAPLAARTRRDCLHRWFSGGKD